MAFSHIRDDVSSNQASKETYFMVDLIWWGSLRLVPMIECTACMILAGYLIVSFYTEGVCII